MTDHNAYIQDLIEQRDAWKKIALEADKKFWAARDCVEFYASRDYRETYGGENHIAMDRGARAKHLLEAWRKADGK